MHGQNVWQWRFDRKIMFMIGQNKLGLRKDLSNIYFNLKCPVSLIYGDKSILFGSDIISYMKDIQQCKTRFQSIKNAYHHIMLN